MELDPNELTEVFLLTKSNLELYKLLRGSLYQNNLDMSSLILKFCPKNIFNFTMKDIETLDEAGDKCSLSKQAIQFLKLTL